MKEVDYTENYRGYRIDILWYERPWIHYHWEVFKGEEKIEDSQSGGGYEGYSDRTGRYRSGSERALIFAKRFVDEREDDE